MEVIIKHQDREEVVIKEEITMQLAMTEVEVLVDYNTEWKVYNSTDCWSSLM